jgi:hypothetical protein
MAGSLLRIQSGWLALPKLAVAKTLPVIQELDTEATAELHETVLDFYNLVDKGNYVEAYQVSYENKWLKTDEGQPTSIGLISQDEFVDTLSSEIGPNGMGLNIISLEILGQWPLPSEQWTSSDRPELQALNFLPYEEIQGVYEVEVGGTLLGACSRWDWSDKVLVARLQGENEWKLLLPGRPDINSPHHEEWFLDRNPWNRQPIVRQYPMEGHGA